MTARFCLCITAILLCHPQVWPQALTKEFPLLNSGRTSPQQNAQADAPPENSSPQSDSGTIPIAEVVPATPEGVPVRIAAREQGKVGDVWTLAGAVEIHYRNYIVRADKITYNDVTGEVVAEGHLHLEGGPGGEQLDATHGAMNLDRQTGHFFDVSGSIGTRQSRNSRTTYESGNPFLFSGREVFKDGPEKYRVLDGSMTSCRLPKPDWEILSSKIQVADGTATARNSRFTLLRVPVFFLPYVTHSVSTESRQTGLLIPVFSTSNTKGTIFGEEIYWVINRSADATVGTEYFSKRGFAPRGEFRYRGRGHDFFTASFHALLDRGLAPGNVDQGGTDLIADSRRDFTPDTRAVTDIEYLSSYVYRQAFEENFSIATSSEVKSQAFLQHEHRGIAETALFSRYQSFQSDAPGDEVRILHLPSLQAEAVDHSLLNTHLMWGFSAATELLTRSEPQFHARNVMRADLYPHLALPYSFAGWTLRPEAAVRETFYSKSENLPSALNGEVSPTLRSATLNRADFEGGLDLRPPAVQRDYSPPWLVRLLGADVRHTIEPDIQYRYVTGVNNFKSVLRFDNKDVVSNTNEVEYSLTQRLFLRHLHQHPCHDDEAQTASGMCGGGTTDWLQWKLAQKYFFDPNFGNAVVEGARNVLTTTLDLSGVAFLYGPRSYSPIVSRLRVRTASATDVEWDVDYDTKAGRLNASNLYATYRRDKYNFVLGSFKLNAPEGPVTSPQNVTAAITNYEQLRLVAAYGNSAQKGLGVGANAGYDFVTGALQFGGIQSSYNWNCCGVSLEYRRYALGLVRDETQYLWSINLAGIGTAGNLRQALRIF